MRANISNIGTVWDPGAKRFTGDFSGSHSRLYTITWRPGPSPKQKPYRSRSQQSTDPFSGGCNSPCTYAAAPERLPIYLHTASKHQTQKNPGAKLLNVKSEETLNTNPESEPQEPSVLILNSNRALIAPAGARMQEIGWLGGTINILAQCRA